MAFVAHRLEYAPLRTRAPMRTRPATPHRPPHRISIHIILLFFIQICTFHLATSFLKPLSDNASAQKWLASTPYKI